MNKNKTLLTIGLVIFIDNIGAGLVVPLLPTLFLNNSIGLVGSFSSAAKSFYFGLSYMLFPVITIISNPYLGHLSDYKGRKFVITLGICGIIFTNGITVISILMHNLWLFFITRLLLGFFSGSYSAASATLMEISSNEREKINNIKFITLIGILGFILSPIFSMLIPAKVTEFSLTIPFIVVFLLSILNLFLIILFFPNTEANICSIANKKPNTFFTSVLIIFKTPNLLKIGVIFFLFQLGYNFYFQMMAINLQQLYNFSIRQIGLFFFIMGICYTCGMYILHPFFNRYFLNRRVINISLIVSVLCIILLSIVILVEFNFSNILLWVLNMLYYIIIPLTSINISKQFIEVQSENQGLIMGAIGQVNSFALICSAILISLHIYLGRFNILTTSIIFLFVFIINYLRKP